MPAPAYSRSSSDSSDSTMGWNSWKKFKDTVEDKVIRQIADATVKNRMKDAGYVYVNIDDTWQKKREAQ